mmetsp:Transcript_6711/g.13908  ORF Transcript_6711/g.13908 Transcript_6711/m.13908 type:complete len:203 (-) Transcript_6711:33-641(-)
MLGNVKQLADQEDALQRVVTVILGGSGATEREIVEQCALHKERVPRDMQGAEVGGNDEVAVSARTVSVVGEEYLAHELQDCAFSLAGRPHEGIEPSLREGGGAGPQSQLGPCALHVVAELQLFELDALPVCGVHLKFVAHCVLVEGLAVHVHVPIALRMAMPGVCGKVHKLDQRGQGVESVCYLQQYFVHLPPHLTDRSVDL